MLACSRIELYTLLSLVDFAPESLKDRVMDCSSNTIITANEGIRGEKKSPLLSNVEKLFKG